MSWSAFQIVLGSSLAALLLGVLGYTMSSTAGKPAGSSAAGKPRRAFDRTPRR